MKAERTIGARRLFATHLEPVRLTAAAALLTAVLGVATTLAGPLLVQQFVDRATTGTTAGPLVAIAVAYMVLALTGTVARVGSGYFAARAGWGVADGLRSHLLRDVTVVRPVLELEGRQVGAVLEEVEGNSDIVGKAIAESGFSSIANVLTAVGILVVMVVVVPPAGLGITLLTIVMFYFFARLTRRATKRWTAARERQTEFFGLVGDSLGARDDLLTLNRASWLVDRVSERLEVLFRVEGRAYMAGRALWPLAQLFFALSLGLALGFGLQSVRQGGATVGTLTLLYLYVNLLQDPLEEISSQADQLQRMMAVLGLSARSLGEDLPSSPTGAGARTCSEIGEIHAGSHSVQFDAVVFGYGDQPVLRDVSFDVPAGGSLGIVGPTGAGKSSIVNLLCGLAPPWEGRVRIGGVDVVDMSPAELASRVTVLSQHAHLFAASVIENVTLFDESVPESRVWDVLDQLGAAEWVRGLPSGLQTRVGVGGRAVSEGEAQTLAGARALLCPKGLLIIDEGTSRLDPKTELAWSKVVKTVQHGRTVVMVAHRHDTLRDVDRVLVLRAGRVAGLRPGDVQSALDEADGIMQ